MKRMLFVLLCLVMLAISGCGTNGQPIVNDELVQDALIEVAARRLAYHVARKNPQIIEPGTAFVLAFQSPDGALVDIGPLLAQGINYLDDEIGDDPLLKSDLETILKLLDIAIIDKDIPLTERQIHMVRVGAAAFGLGLQIAKHESGK